MRELGPGAGWWCRAFLGGSLQRTLGLPRTGDHEYVELSHGKGELPLKDESQHGDGRQQKEGQGPQDGPDHQGESLGKLGGQLTWKTSSPESQMG